MGIDFSSAWKSADRIINTAISLLPNIILATIVFFLVLIIAVTAKTVVRRFAKRRQRHETLALLLGQVIQTIIGVLGLLIALSVVAPSFNAADLIKILHWQRSDWLRIPEHPAEFSRRILLLIHEPFGLGDWISITTTSPTPLEGTVEDIQARATIIVNQTGQRVVIPNAVLFMNPVSVGNPRPKNQAPEEGVLQAQSASAR